MASPLMASMPSVLLDAGTYLMLEAIDPVTGNPITGVVVSGVAIYATHDEDIVGATDGDVAPLFIPLPVGGS